MRNITCCWQERSASTSESISSAELTCAAVHDGEQLVMLPQSSTTVTNVCETVHVLYVSDGICVLT